MKTQINSRGENDIEWQKTKKRVKERDNYQCRFLRCLTPGEYSAVLNTCDNKKLLYATDCAHIRPVGVHPERKYDDNNIVFLCRYAHSCIDNCINPFTGKAMNNNYRWYLWARVYHSKVFSYDPNINYEDNFDSPSLIEYFEKKPKKQTSYKDIKSYW